MFVVSIVGVGRLGSTKSLYEACKMARGVEGACIWFRASASHYRAVGYYNEAERVVKPCWSAYGSEKEVIESVPR